MSLSKYATLTEKKIATDLVRAFLSSGFLVSVYDGEDFTIRNSASESAILDALATTEYDALHITAPGSIAPRVGSVVLIWGNDDALVSDHTDVPAITEIVNRVLRRLGHL